MLPTGYEKCRLLYCCLLLYCCCCYCCLCNWCLLLLLVSWQRYSPLYLDARDHQPGFFVSKSSSSSSSPFCCLVKLILALHAFRGQGSIPAQICWPLWEWKLVLSMYPTFWSYFLWPDFPVNYVSWLGIYSHLKVLSTHWVLDSWSAQKSTIWCTSIFEVLSQQSPHGVRQVVKFKI